MSERKKEFVKYFECILNAGKQKKKEGIDILSSRNHNSAREDRNTLEAFENILLSLMLKRHKKNCNGVKKKKKRNNRGRGKAGCSPYERRKKQRREGISFSCPTTGRVKVPFRHY